MNDHHNGFKMTEIGWLPEEWDVVKLNNLTTESYKTINPAANPDEEFEYYSIPAYQENQKPSLEIGKKILSQKILLKNNAVLFGKLNPRVEKVWKVDSSSNRKKIGSTEWLPIFPDEKKVDSGFLYYLFWSNWVMPKAKKLVSGSTPSRQRVNPKAFYNIKIPLPPLDEQKKIAAVLAAVQEAREKTEAVIAAAKELKKSLMKYLFTYGPVPVTEADKVRLKETEIGVMPEEWCRLKLGDVAEVTSGGTPNRDKKEYWRGNIPWVKTGEIKYNEILDTEEKITKEGLQYSSSKIIPKGTLLMAMYGQGVTRGKVAILGIDAAINQACAAIITIDKVKTKFLYYFFEFKYDEIRKLGHGANQRNLNAAMIKNLDIALPDSSVQEKIIGYLVKIDQKISSEQSKKQALDQLFKPLLHNLMTGKIRVKHLEL